MAKVTREKQMDVSVEALYVVICDFSAYPRFLSEVKSAKVILTEAEKTRVAFELEVIKRFQYELEFHCNGKDEVTWSLVKGSFFKTNNGRWLLKETAPEKTFVSYDLDVTFGFLVPEWISRKLTETSLPRMFDCFEEEAKRKKGGSGGR